MKVAWVLLRKVRAAASDTIQDTGNALFYLVILGLMMVGVGVGAKGFLQAANVTNPSELPIVGPVFSGIGNAMNMGAVALLMGFVGVILFVLADLWGSFREQGVLR